MSFALAGALPVDHRSLLDKAKSLELGGHLRPDAGPWFTTMELMTGGLPRGLMTTIPNNFNPIPNRRTYAAMTNRAKSTKKFMAKGVKHALGQSHKAAVKSAAKALRKGSSKAGKLLAVHKTHEDET